MASNLARRGATLVLLFAVLFGSLAAGPPGAWFLYQVFAQPITHEFLALANVVPAKLDAAPNHSPTRPHAIAVHLAVCIHGWAVLVGHTVEAMVTTPAVIAACCAVAHLLAGSNEERRWARMVALGLLWGPYLLSYTLVLFRISWFHVAVVITLVELNDVNQFVAGMLFGRVRVVASISPNKTLEGYVLGTLLTVMLSMAAKQGAWLGLFVSVTGSVGDLCMSAFKRRLGIKDTGRMLPGHGGMLDRMDSLLTTAPLACVFLQYFG